MNKVMMIDIQIQNLVNQMNSKKSYKQNKAELKHLIEYWDQDQSESSQTGCSSYVVRSIFENLVKTIDLKDLREKNPINRYSYLLQMINQYSNDIQFSDYIGQILVENYRTYHQSTKIIFETYLNDFFKLIRVPIDKQVIIIYSCLVYLQYSETSINSRELFKLIKKILLEIQSNNLNFKLSDFNLNQLLYLLKQNEQVEDEFSEIDFQMLAYN